MTDADILADLDRAIADNRGMPSHPAADCPICMTGSATGARGAAADPQSDEAVAAKVAAAAAKAAAKRPKARRAAAAEGAAPSLFGE